MSLVSHSHADLVAYKCRQLKYQSLEKPVAVSVAVAKAQLQAVGTMEIPIQWNNGKETTFQMLVVPGLPWPILFGENHLHSTQALVDHADPSIHFDILACPSKLPVLFRILFQKHLIMVATPMQASPVYSQEHQSQAIQQDLQN